jgi:hypothetical protein
MKTKINILVLTLITICLFSCNDVLNQSPTDRYTDATVWNDEELITQHLAELYMLTPVMVQDCPAVMTSWNGNTLNRDDNSWGVIMGQSEQMEGSLRPLEMSDEAMYNFGGQSDFNTLKRWGYQVNDTYFQWWGNAYYQIRNLNNFIDKIESSPVKEKEEYKGEARFLRAFCYFAMVKRYGGVPIIKEVQDINADSTVLYPKRNSEQECYDFIISECQQAAEELPVTNVAGRATKYAAYSLISRAALFAGSIAEFGTQQLNGLLGFPKSDANKYYQLCVDACKKIIDSGKYALYNQESDKVQNFKDIFLVKDNCEAIFVKRHSGPDFQAGGSDLWSWDMCECPHPNVWNVGNYDSPYVDFVEAFERKDGTPGNIDRDPNKSYTMDELFGDRDPRFKASVWTNGDVWANADGGVCFGNNHIDMHRGIMKPNGTIVNSRFGSYKTIPAIGEQLSRIAEFNLLHTGFGVMKYLDPKGDDMSWFCTSTTDYLIFRYAEILLNYAEASFELGNAGDALQAINQIRSRAGIANLSSVTRDEIRNERRVELAFENHRYWDLRRWRVAVKTLTTYHTGLTYVLDPSSILDSNGKIISGATPKFFLRFNEKVDGANENPVFPEKNYYWPIGNSRIAQNHNLVENPGYAN